MHATGQCCFSKNSKSTTVCANASGVLPRQQISLPARIAPAAATAASAVTASATVATKATATRPAFLTRASFVYVNRAAIQFGSVQGVHRLFGILAIGHFHESETTGLSRVAVADQADPLHCPKRREGGLELDFGGLVGEVSYENVSHQINSYKAANGSVNSLAS
jgi:hypothetical protein